MSRRPTELIESYVIDQVRCPECSLTCLQKNIYRHLSTIHNWTHEECQVMVAAIRSEKRSREAKNAHICSYCNVIFTSIVHLSQHKTICASQPHLMSSEDNDEGVYEDEMIVTSGAEEVVGIQEFQVEPNSEDVAAKSESSEKPSTSSESKIVPPHRQSTRNAPKNVPTNSRIDMEKPDRFPSINGVQRHRGSQIKCPECPANLDSIEDFINHCHNRHESEDRRFEIERKAFKARKDFKKWFDQRQEDTCTSLTKRTGHGGETLYRCHRVGKYQSVAKSRKSNPRKVDQTCTAYLKVAIGKRKLNFKILVFTEADGSTWANGCFTHIGHELDHKLLWLTESQEIYVRELIDLGWNSDQIFFYIRNEYKDYECKLKYISKNDIRNITVRYNREKSRKYEDSMPENSPEMRTEMIKEEPPKKVAKIESNPTLKTSRPSEGVVEEDEYINVVDDEDQMPPELDKIQNLEN